MQHLFIICTLLLLNSFIKVELAPAPYSHSESEDKQGKQSDKGLKEPQGNKDNDKGEDEMYIFDGDIILSANEMSQMESRQGLQVEDSALNSTSKVKRSAFIGGSGARPVEDLDPKSLPIMPTRTDSKANLYQLWPTTIPYMYDQLLSEKHRETFDTAMEMWSNATCITFVPVHREHRDYLLFRLGEICSSRVGRKGGEQVVTIAEGCSSIGNAAHEIGHALGLWHEHSRPDRDNYIEILEENIDGFRNRMEFAKISDELFEQIPDVGYDIQSIMHYDKYALGKKRGVDKQTIRIRDDADLEELNCSTRLPMGQRRELSFKDKKRTNLLYGCDVNLVEVPCPTPTPTLSTVTATPMVSSIVPTPTTTFIPPTPSPLLPGLRTRNVLTLTFGNGGFGMECRPSPGCSPRDCITDHLGYTTCEEEYHQFQIINHPNITKKRIKSGNTVFLRSINSPANWLECSSRQCKISRCYEDNVLDPFNSSYIPTCARYQFQVWGVNRGKGRSISVHNKVYFKGSSNHTYLNCNGKYCTLLEEGECQRKKHQVIERDGPCPIQTFKVTKLSEI